MCGDAGTCFTGFQKGESQHLTKHIGAQNYDNSVKCTKREKERCVISSYFHFF